MSKENFALRLKASMAQQGKKQVDLIRAASEQGVKLGKSHISQYVSGKTLPRHHLKPPLPPVRPARTAETPLPAIQNRTAK